LVAGALPAVTRLYLDSMHVGDAGASALAAALDRGALPRLEILQLTSAAIGDAGLAALAPALRRHPPLQALWLDGNPFGDEGLAALVAPPPPAGTPPLPTGGLKKLRVLDLEDTQVSDAGCAALAAALDSGALPALVTPRLNDIPASVAAIDAVWEALERSRAEALARAERAAMAELHVLILGMRASS
jgi:Ran GTPase-activating protein (RanGAP) involved in mRNA processing and transport